MEQDYIPFGEDLPVVGQTEVMDKEAEGYKYTGQKEVISIGLYYYGARYYDPSIGRFITEDSYPGEMENPQTQNLYLYVVNNPLRYIDPTGHFIQESSNQRRPDDDPYPNSGSGNKTSIPGRKKNKPSFNLNVKPNLNPLLDLNGDYSFENDWDMVTGGDLKIFLEQVFNNVDVEGRNNFNHFNNILKNFSLFGGQVAEAKDLKDLYDIGKKGYDVSTGLYKLNKDLINYKYTVLMNTLLSNKTRAYNQKNYMEDVRAIIKDVPKMMTLEYGSKYAGKSTFKKYIQFNVTLEDVNKLEDNIVANFINKDIYSAYSDAYKIFSLAGHTMAVELASENVFYSVVTWMKTPIYEKNKKIIQEMGYDPSGFYQGE